LKINNYNLEQKFEVVKTLITIVRHGETEWNRTMQLQGQQNSALTEAGIEQTRQLAEKMKKRHFDVLVCSDLDRARQTAAILNKELNLKIIENKSLRERAFGIMEGLTRDEIKNSYREVYEAYMSRKSAYQIPEGESLLQFYNRAIEGIGNIAEIFRGKKILIVSHGGVLDCVIRKIFHLKLEDERHFSIHNTSVNTISIENNYWVLEEWGNLEHINQSVVLKEFN
jgi:broad specificity phosphatase PhoE